MNDLIPQQKKGKTVDLSHTASFTTHDEAAHCYRRARARLLNPDSWHELAGKLSAEFFLVPRQKGTQPCARVNDHIKIDVPGPGPSSGEGYDWVEIRDVKDTADPSADEESVGMEVFPCTDPYTPGNDIAHFFTGDASSTFIIKRKGNIVTSYYHGRNELPNVQTSSMLDNARNAVVASGAMASLSEAQWMRLIKAFLKEEGQGSADTAIGQ